MIKRNINNVRRMTSHPTLPYCKNEWYLSRLKAVIRDQITHLFNPNISLCPAVDFSEMLLFPAKAGV